MNETPKKISHDCECCIPCRGKFSAAKEKIRVFGKSNVDRCLLAYRATNVDLSVYVDREKLAICRIWLAKCCKIQQLVHSYSTTYIYVQRDIFIFNILYLYSTICIFFQLQPKLFSFNKNNYSTSTHIVFIQQK